MNFNNEKLLDLERVGESIVINIGPLVPTMIMGFHQKGKVRNPEEPADMEFGFSGFQTVCTNDVAAKIMREHELQPWALEGAGYLSISKELLEGEGDLDAESRTWITNLVIGAMGHWIGQGATKMGLCIVQLSPGSFKVPDSHMVAMVHVMVPCNEEDWINLLHVHMTEVQGAQLYRNRVNGTIPDGVSINTGDLSKARVLN